MQLVHDAMNKQWSTGLNKDESHEIRRQVQKGSTPIKVTMKIVVNIEEYSKRIEHTKQILVKIEHYFRTIANFQNLMLIES